MGEVQVNQLFSQGVSPDIYLERVAPFPAISTAFEKAFDVVHPALFEWTTQLTEFQKQYSQRLVSGLLITLDREKFSLKLNVYTPKHYDLLPGIQRLALLLQSRCIVDTDSNESDNAGVGLAVDPDGRMFGIRYELSGTESPDGDPEMTVWELPHA